MRLIDADALCKLAQNSKDRTVDCNDIMRMPTIDAVPVVLCLWCCAEIASGGKNRIASRIVMYISEKQIGSVLMGKGENDG